MGHCIHIYFECKAEKDAAFQDIATSSNTKLVTVDTVKIIDLSSNSNNFVTANEEYLEVDIDVKTKLLSSFMLSKLNRYRCTVKDCEDSEEEPGVALTAFFR